jgi:glycosyltransferase involved in cell wall biosynthesis
VSELYAGAVAVVVPSLCYEVFPLVVAEALAHGAPVVARRIGAIPEVVEESGGGLLFDTMDECRALMGELLHDHGRRLQLAQRGRSHAATHWTEEAYLGRYLPLVDELLAERRATAQAAGARA